jgi:hypothetical protein
MGAGPHFITTQVHRSNLRITWGQAQERAPGENGKKAFVRFPPEADEGEKSMKFHYFTAETERSQRD